MKRLLVGTLSAALLASGCTSTFRAEDPASVLVSASVLGPGAELTAYTVSFGGESPLFPPGDCNRAIDRVLLDARDSASVGFQIGGSLDNVVEQQVLDFDSAEVANVLLDEVKKSASSGECEYRNLALQSVSSEFVIGSEPIAGLPEGHSGVSWHIGGIAYEPACEQALATESRVWLVVSRERVTLTRAFSKGCSEDAGRGLDFNDIEAIGAKAMKVALR